MDVVITFIVCFILLIGSVLKGIFVGYPLILGLVLFIALGMKKGYSFFDVAKMAYNGGKKSFIVLQIFILIGAITASWMASGTVSSIVYYGLKFLNPHMFILSAFVISSLVSFLIGTSFGTVGTVGIALIVMAKGGGINVSAAAGAILSGAYFGDRCSPMSSSANLTAHLTNTDIYLNIKNMFKTAIIPLILTIVFYLLISLKFPLISAESNMQSEILKVYNINIFILLPAFIILIFSFFKINVKTLMAISIAAAAVISIALQHNTFMNTIKYIIFGYSMEKESTLKNIISGGGIISMLKTSVVVFVSSAFTGIFEGTGMLNFIEKTALKAKGYRKIFLISIIISISTAAFGCSQALAVILTHMLINKVYKQNNISNNKLAIDIENTAIVIAPLIPWNIAVLVPLTTLRAGFGAIGYAVYLYLIPLINLAFISKKME